MGSAPPPAPMIPHREPSCLLFRAAEPGGPVESPIMIMRFRAMPLDGLDPPFLRASASQTRRHFLRLLATAVVAIGAPIYPSRANARPLPGITTPGDHPEPRPRIDGSNVLTAADLGNAPHLIELFDAVREMPHIVDGIMCYCGCASIEYYRSLLTCYEAPGMAQFCEICEGQARLAHSRWREGQTLDQIRRATDARYGHGQPHHHP